MKATRMTNAENNNICVEIPVKDEAKGLERLILSILAQNPQPDEVVVVDAGSTDGTLQIIKGLSKRYLELRLISRPKQRHCHHDCRHHRAD